jgi:membrane fusion protein (multidrug efflux system)
MINVHEKRRRPRHMPLLIVAAVLAVGVGAGAWYHASGRESTDNAQVEAHITPLAARVGGAILDVSVRDNQRVAAGDVLVRIDARDYDVALARARAELADAEAAAAIAATGLPIAETTSASDIQRAAGSTASAAAASAAAAGAVDAAGARLQAARARAVEAEATAEKARKDRDRLNGLIAKEEISQQQFDAAVASAKVAEAAVDSARAAVLEAETGVRGAESRLAESRGAVRQAQASQQATEVGPAQIRAARARLDAARARVAQARAAVAQAELQLEYTTVKAPVAGVVSRKSVEPGQVVQPGQALLALVSLADVWVVANFKETQLGSIHPGQRATVEIDAYDRDVEGRVESIAAATGAKFSLLPAENASGNFVKVVQRVPVKIAIPAEAAADVQMRPGMSVVVTVHIR